MSPVKRTRSLQLLAACGLVLAGCRAHSMERVPVDDAGAPAAERSWPVPPPAPQKMVAPPTAAPPSPAQSVVQPMSEAERTEVFRKMVGPTTRSFAPPAAAPDRAPQQAPARIIEREVRYVPSGHVHTVGCSPGCELGRVAVYAGLGAIIGHQYDHRGRGAAIGVGLALLDWPWWGSRCWRD